MAKPIPRSDPFHPSHWTKAELRYELAHQESGHANGPGKCGHVARGSGYCANCLRAELTKREGV